MILEYGHLEQNECLLFHGQETDHSICGDLCILLQTNCCFRQPFTTYITFEIGLTEHVFVFSIDNLCLYHKSKLNGMVWIIA